MSAMAERIREPERLYSFPREAVEQVVQALTEEGGREFFRQVHEAAERSRELGDLRPLNEVFESWFRTLLFVSKPGFDEMWELSQGGKGPLYSPQDIRERHRRGRLR